MRPIENEKLFNFFSNDCQPSLEKDDYDQIPISTENIKEVYSSKLNFSNECENGEINRRKSMKELLENNLKKTEIKEIRKIEIKNENFYQTNFETFKEKKEDYLDERIKIKTDHKSEKSINIQLPSSKEKLIEPNLESLKEKPVKEEKLILNEKRNLVDKLLAEKNWKPKSFLSTLDAKKEKEQVSSNKPFLTNEEIILNQDDSNKIILNKVEFSNSNNEKKNVEESVKSNKQDKISKEIPDLKLNYQRLSEIKTEKSFALNDDKPKQERLEIKKNSSLKHEERKCEKSYDLPKKYQATPKISCNSQSSSIISQKNDEKEKISDLKKSLLPIISKKNSFTENDNNNSIFDKNLKIADRYRERTENSERRSEKSENSFKKEIENIIPPPSVLKSRNQSKGSFSNNLNGIAQSSQDLLEKIKTMENEKRVFYDLYHILKEENNELILKNKILQKDLDEAQTQIDKMFIELRNNKQERKIIPELEEKVTL